MEIASEQRFEIDPETFEQIKERVHEVRTRYSTWYEFVDDAVRIFATWWNSPPDAQKILTLELWPHLTHKQHEIMKDPKLGQIEVYESLKKQAEEYNSKNGTLDPPELEVDDTFEKNAIEIINKQGFLVYSIKRRRVQDIKKILTSAKSVSGATYYQSTQDFMNQVIRLYINFWNDPYSNLDEMSEMFPFLTQKQCRLWYSLDPRKDGGYMTFKKLAAEYHKKSGRKMIMDDGIEQLVEEKIVLQVVEPLSPAPQENIKELIKMKKQIKNMKETGDFKEPENALQRDQYPLIRSFYNRFFPIKLILTDLSEMIYQENNKPIDYNAFREQVHEYVVRFSSVLKEKEKNYTHVKGDMVKKGLERNKKISTGLPLPRPSLPANATTEQLKEATKWESSKERFLEYYVGPTTKQWTRKKKESNSNSFFDGALNSMGLVSITEDDGRLKINLTEKGAEFFDFPNEILDNFPNILLEEHKPISNEECKFLMENVIKREPFSLEKKLVDSTYDIMEKAGDHFVFGSELDDNYKMLLTKFAEDHINDKNKERFWKDSRQATMGRLSEMGLVNWTIYSKEDGDNTAKYGKSCFSLNESLKNNW